jgi:hypothetical protein
VLPGRLVSAPIEPLPPAAFRYGSPRATALLAFVEAIFYIATTGRQQRRLLPSRRKFFINPPIGLDQLLQ